MTDPDKCWQVVFSDGALVYLVAPFPSLFLLACPRRSMYCHSMYIVLLARTYSNLPIRALRVGISWSPQNCSRSIKYGCLYECLGHPAVGRWTKFVIWVPEPWHCVARMGQLRLNNWYICAVILILQWVRKPKHLDLTEITQEKLSKEKLQNKRVSQFIWVQMG